MGLFTKNSPETTADKASQPASDLLDGALDTLASIIRITGEYSLPLPDSDDFSAECEAWARHVLTGASIDRLLRTVADEGGEPESAERSWREVRHFYRGRRRDEKEHFSNRTEEYRGVIWDLVGALRSVGTSTLYTEGMIQEAIAQLEAAAASGSLEALRDVLGTSVTAIKQAVETQQKQFDAQLQTLTSQLEAMRRDLLASRRQMEMDPLTQTHNRGAFDAALKRYVALASLAHEPLSLLITDLDHFKQVNDRYGHQAGDLVLTEAANCLVRCFLRRDDFIARYGGEEFAVILPDTTLEVAGKLADNLLNRLRESEIVFQGNPIGVTSSIGYACLAAGESPEQLFERADAALYRAKQAGRNRAEAA